MITSLYVAILGLVLIALSIHVIRGRRKFRASFGDNDNLEMRRRIRAQANLTEYGPIFLILLGYAEQARLHSWALHGFGIVFLLGRMMHAYSLLSAEQYEGNSLTTNPVWRIRGMIFTFATIGLLAITLLLQRIQ